LIADQEHVLLKKREEFQTSKEDRQTEEEIQEEGRREKEK